MQKKYVPLAKPWSAIELFAAVKTEDIVLDEIKKNDYHEYILADLCVESDASNLYHELMTNQVISDEFRLFLEPWHQEELNHAAGFRRIMSLLFGVDEEQLTEQMKQRVADFSMLQPVLGDEFKLAVMLAYDECYSTMSYRNDTFYQSLGPAEFNQWIELVIKDEARHFMNAVKLIHYKHRHRIGETRQVLDTILEMESANNHYKATFLLHNDADYVVDSAAADHLKQQCAAKVFTVITR